MKREYHKILRLPELSCGPVENIDLDWPLDAELFDVVDEGNSIRLVINVYPRQQPGTAIFEKRLWDPDYRPEDMPRWNHLSSTAKRSIAGAKNSGLAQLKLWSTILKLEPKDAYIALKTGAALYRNIIRLSVMIGVGFNGQYPSVLAYRVIPRVRHPGCSIPRAYCVRNMGKHTEYRMPVQETETIPARQVVIVEEDRLADWCEALCNGPAPILNDWLKMYISHISNDMKRYEPIPTRPGERVASMI